jgi:hypothetical protein
VAFFLQIAENQFSSKIEKLCFFPYSRIFKHHKCNDSTGSMVAGSAIFSCNEMKKREDNLPGGLPNNAVLSSILFMALSSVPTIRTSQLLQYI